MKVNAKEIFEKITSVRALLFYILLSILSLIKVVSSTLDVDVRYISSYSTIPVEIKNESNETIPVEVKNPSYDPISVEVTNGELDVEVTNSWFNAVPVEPR